MILGKFGTRPDDSLRSFLMPPFMLPETPSLRSTRGGTANGQPRGHPTIDREEIITVNRENTATIDREETPTIDREGITTELLPV